MPTYDYLCLDCRKPFDVFMTYDEYGKKPVRCAHCGSESVKRRVPRVRIAKSEESRMEGLSDGLSGFEGLDEDPKEMGRMMRRMGREMGEDLPPEFDDVVDRLESGQSPEQIETALPDLGAGDTDDDL